VVTIQKTSNYQCLRVPPFTRLVGSRSTQATSNTPAAAQAIQGEPKNHPPFAQPDPIVAPAGNGFNWADAAIGAAAGIGIALSVAGAAGPHASPRRRHEPSAGLGRRGRPEPPPP